MYDFPILGREGEKLINKFSKQDNWPVKQSDLVNKFIIHFIEFTKRIDFKRNLKLFSC